MLMVLLVLTMMGIIAYAALDGTTMEMRIIGMVRHSAQAEQVADGALMEVINDNNFDDYAPSFNDSTLKKVYTPSTDSSYASSSYLSTGYSQQSYTATIELIRSAPVFETSTQLFRAFVYEVSARGDVESGKATRAVKAETFKEFAFPTGTVLPRRHAR